MSFKIGVLDKNFVSGKTKQFLVASIATIGIFGLGNVLAFSSSANLQIFANESLSIEEKSWFRSIPLLGALVSCPVAGICVRKIGRKNSMLIFTAPFIVGWLLISVANTLQVLLFGRFLTGFCGGAFSLAVPIYISEISEAKIRGALISLFQLMMVLGIFFTYMVGSYLSWSNLALVSAFVPVFALFLLPFVPQTPRYLLRTGKSHQAGRSLHWLRNSEYISQTELEIELLQIEQSIEESQNWSPSLSKIFSSHLRKPLLISMSLMLFQQFSGFTPLTSSPHFVYFTPLTLTQILTVQLISVAISLICVDKIGRKILLILSQTLMGVSLAILGFFQYGAEGNLKNNIWIQGVVSENFRWVQMTGSIFYIFAFSLGIGPLSWTVMAEILPPNVKWICSSIAISLVWFLSFVVSYAFNNIKIEVGVHYYLWFFSSVCFLGLVSILISLPETKGKSLEEIQEIFKKPEKEDGSEETGSPPTSPSYMLKSVSTSQITI